MDKKLQRGIITSVVVLVAGLAAYKLLGKKGKSGSGGGENSGGGGNTGGGTSQPNPSLDFRSLANQLFDAFDGYGTSVSKVKEIFKLLKSNADYDALKSAYGVREVSSGRGNIFVSNFEGDLPATLRDELDSDEVAEINQILTSNGISRTI
jgi:hypothetical protein